MPSIGIREILFILLIFALIFGAKRLPEIARGLGSGIRNLQGIDQGPLRRRPPGYRRPARLTVRGRSPRRTGGGQQGAGNGRPAPPGSRLGLLFFAVLVDLIGFGIVLPVLAVLRRRFRGRFLADRSPVRRLLPRATGHGSALGTHFRPRGAPARHHPGAPGERPGVHDIRPGRLPGHAVPVPRRGRNRGLHDPRGPGVHRRRDASRPQGRRARPHRGRLRARLRYRPGAGRHPLRPVPRFPRRPRLHRRRALPGQCPGRPGCGFRNRDGPAPRGGTSRFNLRCGPRRSRQDPARSGSSSRDTSASPWPSPSCSPPCHRWHPNASPWGRARPGISSPFWGSCR